MEFLAICLDIGSVSGCGREIDPLYERIMFKICEKEKDTRETCQKETWGDEFTASVGDMKVKQSREIH